MKPSTLAGLVGLAALGLTACDDRRSRGGERVNAALCYDFKAKTAPAALPVDGANAVDDCTRRWAYALAGARDSAEVVAEAVTGACSAQLTRWNQQSVAQPGPGTEAVSILTGEPTTPIAEHNSFTRARALLHVVQARAGRCAPPPIANGAPEGIG